MTTETRDAHTPSPHETEERLRLARRVANEGFWDWDLSTQTVYFDPRYYFMAGYAMDEFPHRLEEFQQRVHPADQAEVMAIVQEFLKGQACRCEAEFRFRKKAGDYLWIHSKWLIAERDDQGKPSRLVGTHANITERKLAEKALRASEELLSETAHIAQVGGWEIDLDGNILAWTEETFCIHELESGLPPSIDQAIAFYHPDDQPRVRAVVQRAIESGEAFDFEARLFTAKKNLRWVRAIARVRYQEGRPSGIFGTVQDITERKRSEEALQQREALFRAVVENTYDGILLIEKDRRIAYVSPSHKRVSGYSPEDAQGSEALSYVHPDDQAHAAEALSQISQHPGQGISLEYRLRHKLGHWIWIEATVTNLLDDPYVNAFVVNSRDITDRKRAEQELRTTERRLRNEKDFVEKLFDVTDDTIFVFEPATGKPVRWNIACRKITGYSDEEIASLKFPDAYYSQE